MVGMTSRTKGILAGTAVALLLVGAGVWWVFLRDDAPEEVSLDAATEQVTSTTGTGDAGDGQATTTVADGGIDGTWTVDAESGTFDFDTATGSFAGFRVDEELVQIGATEAVGRTGQVSGTMVIEGSTLRSADVEVVMTDIRTDQSRRDNKVQEALETDQFPTATFSLREPVDLGPGAAAGEEVAVQAVGDLNVHGVTRQVTVDLDTQLVDGTAVVVGSTPVTFSDFGVEVPSAPVVLSVADEGTIEFQLLFVR
jgi:polyisoprenoid-binding protein YceI